jgi:hypothetical protein
VDNRRERYVTTGEVQFGENRTLVVSVLGGRIVVGQRITFRNDDGSTGKAFLKNAPSLDVAAADELIAALTKAVAELKRRGTGATLTTSTGRE